MVDADTRREAAIKRLEAKRGFSVHAAIYVIVNILLVVVWAFTARGYFWPIWPILGWGVAVAIHGWMTYFQKPISEDEIRREMEKGG
jgi:hypothetical protein